MATQSQNFMVNQPVQTVGAKATTPTAKVTKPTNTLSSSQTQPVAKASYSGGESVPAMGTSTYNASVGMNNGLYGSKTASNTQAPIQNTPYTASQNTSYTGAQSNQDNSNYTPKGIYTGSASNLANTQPASGATSAQGGLLNIASGNANNQNTQNLYTAQGLLGRFATNPTPEVQESYNKLKQFNQDEPLLRSTQASIPMAAAISTGRGQILGNELAGIGQGLSNTFNAALQGQGQQINAANDVGNLAATGQGQQISAGSSAGNVANTAQGNVISAQGAAGGLTKPFQNGYVVIDPTTGQAVSPTGAQGAAFTGNTIDAAGALGGKYTTNDATLRALNGQNGQPGMVGNFINSLNQSGLNSGPTAVLNSVKQMASANLSGPAAQLQNQFYNIVAQYAKILGDQNVNTLLTSSQNQTVDQFLQSLDQSARLVQGGLLGTGTGTGSVNTGQNTQSSNSNTGGSIYNF